MKKLLALLLAVAMVLSLSAVAMADEDAKTQVGDITKLKGLSVGKHLYSKGGAITQDTSSHGGNTPSDPESIDVCFKPIAYGDTVYLPLYEKKSSCDAEQLSRADEVSDLKVSAKWEENGEYIKSVEIGKKNGYYFVIIKTTGTSLDENDVEGTLTFSGRVYKDQDKKEKVKLADGTDNKVDITLTLGYGDADTMHITDTKKIFDFSKAGLVKEDDAELEVYDDTTATGVTFTVDTTHQDKVVISCDLDGIDEVEDKYAEANLDFYEFNGASFKKTGELYIPADEGTYLYEIVDGAAKEVDATYDEYEEAFTLKTKTLGVYVVSDIKLDTAAAAVTDATTANPSTGAAL